MLFSEKGGMMDRKDAIRNLGIIAHIDAGKTTLTERILHKAGELRYCGAVDDGTTVSDYLQQERERGISIVSAAVTCFWRGVEIDIVDTPGHIDFTAEVERSLRVMDAVVAVFCGVHGVQAQSEMVWRRAMRYGLPSMAFINKLDRDGASFTTVLEQLQELLEGASAVVMTFPCTADSGEVTVVDVVNGRTVDGSEICSEACAAQLAAYRDALAEAASEWEPRLLEDYLESGELPVETLRSAMRRGVLAGKLIPVFCGSAALGIGVDALLDGVVDFLPSPQERMESQAGRRFFNVPVARMKRGDGGEFASMSVVKPFRCEWPCDYIVVRIYSGRIVPGMNLVNNSRGSIFPVGGIWRLQAADLTPLDEAVAGEIVGLSVPEDAKMPRCCTGDTLVEEGGPEIRLARMKFPEPVVSINLSPLDEAGRSKLPDALRELAEGDPTLRVRVDEEMGQCRVSGLGELHLQITKERLETEYGVPTRAGRILVSYRSTVENEVVNTHEFRRELPGGMVIQAKVTLSVAPQPQGGGVTAEFPYEENSELPDDCKDAVRAAVQEIVAGGGPSGYPLADTRVTVQEASTVMTEASEPAFLSAARDALVEALDRGGEIALEPVMRLEVSAPESQIGNVITDVATRGGKVLSCDTLAAGNARMVAMVPVAQLISYATELRSITGGRAEFTAEPACMWKVEKRTSG